MFHKIDNQDEIARFLRTRNVDCADPSGVDRIYASVYHGKPRISIHMKSGVVFVSGWGGTTIMLDEKTHYKIVEVNSLNIDEIKI